MFVVRSHWDLGVVFYTAVLQQKLIKQPYSLLETKNKKTKLVIVASNEEYEFEFLKHPETNIHVPIGLKTK